MNTHSLLLSTYFYFTSFLETAYAYFLPISYDLSFKEIIEIIHILYVSYTLFNFLHVI